MIQKQATPTIRDAIAELANLRALKKDQEVRENELTTTIKDYVENTAGSIKHNATLLALIKEKVRAGIDSALLKAKYPEVAEACSKTTFYLQVECC